MKKKHGVIFLGVSGILLLLGLTLVTVGPLAIQAPEDYGSLKVSDAPITVKQGETFTVDGVATVDLIGGGFVYDISVAPAGSRKDAWNGSKLKTLSSGSTSISLQVTAPTEYTGELTLSLRAFTQETYSGSDIPRGKLTSANTVTIEVVKSGETFYDVNTDANPDLAGKVYTDIVSTPEMEYDVESVEEGTQLKVTPHAYSGYKWKSWSGTVPSEKQDETPLYLTVDEDEKIVMEAEEVIEYHELRLSTDPADVGSTQVVWYDGDMRNGLYSEGTEVTIKATPIDDFVKWTGDAESNSNPLTFTINASMHITASFESGTGPYTVDTSVEEGKGSITLEPSQTEYEEGTRVTATAEPLHEGYVFDHWGSGGSSPTKEFLVYEDRILRAYFKISSEATLTIKTSPNEGGYVNYTQSKSVTVEKGKDIEVQAFANEGYTFDHWTTIIENKESKELKGNPFTVTMTKDKTIVAHFVREKDTLGKIRVNLDLILFALAGLFGAIGVYGVITGKGG